MKGTLEGNTVRLGPDGLVLYEQGGYGRPGKGEIRLSPHEALYLLHRQKIEIPGHSFDSLLSYFSRGPSFLRTFLVYHDLRERGYAVQPGPQDFRVYRRGERPGTGESRHLVRVLSERDLVHFEKVAKEAISSSHMRKQFVLAVVDDEDELTYYEVRTPALPSEPPLPVPPHTPANLVGTKAVITSPPAEMKKAWYGKSFDPERVLLSGVEAFYLSVTGACSFFRDGKEVSNEELLSYFSQGDTEFPSKVHVYIDLRKRGYVPQTGYKFGHHFRVYRQEKSHSELLVQAVGQGETLPMNLISRSVRLAHSVKKKMLFACVYPESIQYIEFGRIKL
ncbi:MAG: tRNA-intron lyase [Methanomicrobiales archaeon]|nr:tRNA-intron lyase [Methanomicrobiales archaeon]